MVCPSTALARILTTVLKVARDDKISAGHQSCRLSGVILRLASVQREVVVAGRGYSEVGG